MKNLLLVGLLSAVIASSASAALKQGEIAPEFQAQASLGGKAFTFSLKDALKKGPVVVYFYPAAYTSGCNLQAHTFADYHDKFAAAGASIVGISLDSIARLNDFSADPNFCAGKIAVASDPDGKVAKKFDLTVKDAVPGRKDTRGADLDHGFAERTTFVVTPDGRIAASVSGAAPRDNVEKTLEAVQKLAQIKPAAK